ncbi:hypothetical protein Ciccas_006579 [Cichlidogyrus casuarinus]|uniref:B30.2/SPRY domain-containing protein n=1 Tax=Cichlidogyrus casuarinus TaxID=1844966 RepID=A0ABD2Q974_9PLAT
MLVEKSKSAVLVSIGVNFSGLTVFCDKLKIQRLIWSGIEELAHKGTGVRVKYVQLNEDALFNDSTLDLFARKVSPIVKKTKLLNLRFSHEAKAAALYQNLCESHQFFRSVTPSYNTMTLFFRLKKFERKEMPKLNATSIGSRIRELSLSRSIMDGVDSEAPSRRRSMDRTSLFRTRSASRSKAPQESGVTNPSSSNGHIAPPIVDTADPDQILILPGSPCPVLVSSALPPVSVNVNDLSYSPGTYITPSAERFHFPKQHWHMSFDDCTSQIGLKDNRDVTVIFGSPIQGCRASHGVRGPGAYYYRATIMNGERVRLGWSTNDASHNLGSDDFGFGLGIKASGRFRPSLKLVQGDADTGTFFTFNGVSQEVHQPLKKGDIIGCYLWLKPSPEDPNKVGEAVPMWTVNGRVDSQCLFDFECGPEEDPLLGECNVQWFPLETLPASRVCTNSVKGWRLNPNDATSQAHLKTQDFGNFVQAATGKGWHGIRANKYFYEVQCEEHSGLARVGWSTEKGTLLVGADEFGFGFGADKDGFGINGQQGKKLHKNEIENYGRPFKKGDVVGCFIDLDVGAVKWNLNGELLGQAYQIEPELLAQEAFFPTVSLVDTTLSVNFGEKLCKFRPKDGSAMLMLAESDCVAESAAWQEQLSVDRQECILNVNEDENHTEDEFEFDEALNTAIRNTARFEENCFVIELKSGSDRTAKMFTATEITL